MSPTGCFTFRKPKTSALLAPPEGMVNGDMGKGNAPCFVRELNPWACGTSTKGENPGLNTTPCVCLGVVLVPGVVAGVWMTVGVTMVDGPGPGVTSVVELGVVTVSGPGNFSRHGEGGGFPVVVVGLGPWFCFCCWSVPCPGICFERWLKMEPGGTGMKVVPDSSPPKLSLEDWTYFVSP